MIICFQNYAFKLCFQLQPAALHTGRLVSQPAALHPWPEGVHVSSIAVIGVPFYIRGLSGNERVHVFGQRMKPVSLVTPVDCGSLRVTVPPHHGEGDADITPGWGGAGLHLKAKFDRVLSCFSFER